MNQITIKIDGMVCVSCEHRIEQALIATGKFTKVLCSYSKGIASAHFSLQDITVEDIVFTIEEAGYYVISVNVTEVDKSSVNKNRNMNKKEKVSKDKKPKDQPMKINHVLITLVLLLGGYLLLKRIGFMDRFNIFPQVKESTGYGMLFLTGLFTSLHCVAMCGGINLSQCMSNQQEKQGHFIKSSFQYNLGRVISYTIVGGIVGGLGSVFRLPDGYEGIVQLAAGVFMVIMGFNMLGLSSVLKRFQIRLPKIVTRKVYQQRTKKGPFVVGLINGLMPCGPLQAMQLFALSTQSVTKGAIAMLLFSLGTVPLMFGLGALSSYLNQKRTKIVTQVGAILVVVLGLSMFSNGLGLSGIYAGPVDDTQIVQAMRKDDLQLVTTTLEPGDYTPISVEAGTSVRWNIKAEESTLNGCNDEIIIREYGIKKKLEVGDNYIEFTPTEPGTYVYSCWMGMIRSVIYVRPQK